MNGRRYQLACPRCSQVHAISTAQAGETIRCACGDDLLVPTLRELRQLPVLDEAPAESGSSWNVSQGIVFVVGCLLVVAAVIATWRLEPRRRALNIERPEFRELQIDLNEIGPLDAWKAWVAFRDQRLDVRETPQYLASRARYRELSMYLYAWWTAAAIGVLLIGLSLVGPWTAKRKGHLA